MHSSCARGCSVARLVGSTSSPVTLLDRTASAAARTAATAAAAAADAASPGEKKVRSGRSQGRATSAAGTRLAQRLSPDSGGARHGTGTARDRHRLRHRHGDTGEAVLRDDRLRLVRTGDRRRRVVVTETRRRAPVTPVTSQLRLASEARHFPADSSQPMPVVTRRPGTSPFT